MKRLLFAVAMAVSANCFAQEPVKPIAKIKAVNIKNGKLEFVAKASPGSVSIKGLQGKFKDVQPQIAEGKLSGIFLADMKSFTTDMKLRDEHYNREMETDKFPEVKFDLAPVQMVGKQTCSGTLMIKGNAAAPKSCKISFEGGHVVADLEVSLAAHKIKAPSNLGITVDDVVKVHVDFDLVL